MLRFALSALLVLLLLGVGVAFLPAPRSSEGGGVELSGVKMRLYPRTEEKGVVWLFGAKTIAFDPASSESTLSGLEQGRRVVDGKTQMYLTTKSIIVDANNNLFASRAVMEIPEKCARFSLGDANNPRSVVIDQNVGFSGPNVLWESPSSVMKGYSVKSNFAVTNIDLDTESAEFHTVARIKCNSKKQSSKRITQKVGG